MKSGKKIFLRSCIALAIWGLVLYPCAKAFALPESKLEEYAQAGIMFYDPYGDNCTELETYYESSGGETDHFNDTSNYNSGDYTHWNGSCSGVNSYSNFLSTQVPAIRSSAIKYNVPWEAMAAQVIQESGGATREVCPFNPLGLTGKPSCDGKHRTFTSHQEAYDYYFNSIKPVKETKGRFAQSPFSYIEYIQYGVPHGSSYAQCASGDIARREFGCGGHRPGDPTPGYVGSVSALICGIQKWAQANGIPISSENYSNYQSGYINQEPTNEPIEQPVSGGGTIEYCDTGGDDNGDTEGDDDYIGTTEISSGGLTYEQAKQFMKNYGANKNNSSAAAATSGLWTQCNGGGSNCVTFSAFFLNKFTNTNVGSTPGNGNQVVGNLARRGVPTGTTPQVWSVFSWDGGTYGHTGVILGYHDGYWIVGHASCSRKGIGAGDGTLSGGGSGFVVRSQNLREALWMGASATGAKYAYLGGQTNTASIESYLSSGV